MVRQGGQAGWAGGGGKLGRPAARRDRDGRRERRTTSLRRSIEMDWGAGKRGNIRDLKNWRRGKLCKPHGGRGRKKKRAKNINLESAVQLFYRVKQYE